MLMHSTIAYQFNIIMVYKFRHGSNLIHLIHYGKVVLTITSMGWLVATHIKVDRNTGGKTSKIKCLFESNLRHNCFKSFTGLAFYAHHPWTPNAMATHYTKYLAPDIVPNAQNNRCWIQILEMNLLINILRFIYSPYFIVTFMVSVFA